MNCNTYVSISLLVYHNKPGWNCGRIYTSVEDAKLDLHLDLSYWQAKKELAKLMLRTGEMPRVIGPEDGTDCTMYILDAFLT